MTIMVMLVTQYCCYIVVFWVMTLCSLVGEYQHLSLQGRSEQHGKQVDLVGKNSASCSMILLGYWDVLTNLS